MGVRLEQATSLPPAGTQRRRRIVMWWATLGVAFLVFQLYLYGRWIASGNATPTHGVGVPGWMHAGIWIHYVLGAVATVAATWYLLVRPWRREGHVTSDGLFFLAFLTCFWQDLLANYFRFWVIYSPGWFNLGSWYNFVPGWHGGHANLQPEPLTFFLLMYPTVGFGFVYLATQVMRRIEARRGRPFRGIEMFLVAFALLGIADFVLEVAWVRLGLYVYPSTIKWLTLFPGRVYQFPVYESICWGASWAALACVRLHRNQQGEAVWEKEISELRASPRRKTLMRFLAFVAVANLGYLAYNVETAAISRHAGPWPTEVTRRPYFTYLCNGHTLYACPKGEVGAK